MICTNCGAQVPDGFKFCTNCGTKVSAPAPAPEQPAPVQPFVSAADFPAPEIPSVEIPPVQQDNGPAAEQPVNTPVPEQTAYAPAPEQPAYTPAPEAPAYAGYQQPAYQGYPQPAPEAPSYQQPVYSGYPQPAPENPYQQTPYPSGGFTPPPAPQQTAKPRKKGKPGLIIAIAAVAVIAVVLGVLFITGVLGGRNEDPGTRYVATDAEQEGVSIDAKSILESDFVVVLHENGKCSVEFDGDTFKGVWTQTGSKFEMTVGDLTFKGTLKNGVLTLDNFQDSGAALILYVNGDKPVTTDTDGKGEAKADDKGSGKGEAKADDKGTKDEQGGNGENKGETPATTPETPATTPAAEADSVVGKYTGYAMEDGDLPGYRISIADMDVSIEVRADGTFSMIYAGKTVEGTWKQNGDKLVLTANDDPADATYKDGVLVLRDEDDGFALYFCKEGVTPDFEVVTRDEAMAAYAAAQGTAEPTEPATPAEETRSYTGVAVTSDAFSGYYLDIKEFWEEKVYIRLESGGTVYFGLGENEMGGSYSVSGSSITLYITDNSGSEPVSISPTGTIDGNLILFNDFFGTSVPGAEGIGVIFCLDGKEPGISIMTMEEILAAMGLGSVPTGAPSTPAPSGISDELYEFWNGDFYGYYKVNESSGEYKELYDKYPYWDCYATITMGRDGTGSILFMDESCEPDEYLAKVTLRLEDDGTEHGTAYSVSGIFYQANITADEWTISSNALSGIPNHILFSGTYSDESGSFRFTVIMRPWGQRWEDMGQNIPDYYTSWYLPLIEAGKPMPESIELPDD